MTLLLGKDPYQLPFSFTEIGQIFFGIMIEIPERGKVKKQIQNPKHFPEKHDQGLPKSLRHNVIHCFRNQSPKIQT